MHNAFYIKGGWELRYKERYLSWERVNENCNAWLQVWVDERKELDFNAIARWFKNCMMQEKMQI